MAPYGEEPARVNLLANEIDEASEGRRDIHPAKDGGSLDLWRSGPGLAIATSGLSIHMDDDLLKAAAERCSCKRTQRGAQRAPGSMK